MGTFAGNALIDEVARRLRDTLHVAYPAATVLNILNRVQDAVNMRLGLVHGSATLATTATALYATSAIAAGWGYIVQAHDQNQRVAIASCARGTDHHGLPAGDGE